MMNVFGEQLPCWSIRGFVISVCLITTGCLNVFVDDPEKIVLYENKNSQSATTALSRSSKPDPAPRFHIVRTGDTVYQISRRYDTPIRSIIDQNRLRPPYVLKSGRRLTLPPPRYHTVREGDTIYSISRRYNLAMNRIVKANNIAPPYQIFARQKLKLYGAPSAQRRQIQLATTKARVSAPIRQKASVQRKSAIASQKQAGRTALKASSAKRRPISSRKPAPRSGKFFLLPVRGRIISGFGAKQKGLHNDGVNIAAPSGTSVRAAENGIVVYSGNELLGYGNMILLRHADGLMTAYGHNQSVLVQKGQKIRRGQIIAKVGRTGNVSVPQLHFEIRKGKNAVDPARFIKNLS